MCYFQDFRCRSRKGFEANSLPTCIAGSSSQAFCNLFLRNNDPKTSNVVGAHDNVQSSKQDQSSKGKRWKKIHQNHVAHIVTPGVLVMFKDTPKPLQDLCHFCRFKVSRTAAQLLSTILQKSSNLGRAMAGNRFGRHEFQGVFVWTERKDWS